MTQPSIEPTDMTLRADRTFETSPSWRRRFKVRTAPVLVYWIGFLAFGWWLSSPYLVALAVILGGISLVQSYRQGVRRSLTLGVRGVTYREPPSLRFETAWSNVERVVRLSTQAESVALLLRENGTRIGDVRRLTDEVRSTPYPFLRTVPLQPFIDSFAGSELERRIRELAPHVLERPIERLERPRPPLSARALGVVLVVVPGVVAVGWALINGTGLLGFAPIFAVIVTLLLLTLHRGWTGERLFDAVGRSLLHPGPRESRFAALIPIAFLSLFVFAVGVLGLEPTRSPTGPDCRAAAFGGTPPLPEPSWPGTPTASRTLSLGSSWTTASLTEAGIRELPAGDDSFLRTVRAEIRAGLVQMGALRLPEGGVAAIYLYELACAANATQAAVVFPADEPSRTKAVDTTREDLVLGTRNLVRVTYHLTDAGSVALVRIYQWVENGHLFRLISRTDGPGDPRDAIEAVLGT